MFSEKMFFKAGMLAACVVFISIGYRGAVFASRRQMWGDYVYRIDTTEKIVGLTYDDGPDPMSTIKILDVLRQHRVKATFFMVGERLEKNIALAQAVIMEGHELGNHSYTHRKMVWKTPATIRKEIGKTDSLIRTLGVEREIHFRSPYRAQFLALPYVLRKMGKKNIFWDVDSFDWESKSAERMAQHVLQKVKPGSIILFHDSGLTVQQTAAATDTIIETLTERGYRFATISQLLHLTEGSETVST